MRSCIAHARSSSGSGGGRLLRTPCSARASAGRRERCGGASASAASRSASAPSSVWPGSAYMRSRLKLSKPARAASAPRRACAAVVDAAERRSCASSNLCTPSDRRLTPARGSRANRPCSNVPGIRLERDLGIRRSGSRARDARRAGARSRRRRTGWACRRRGICSTVAAPDERQVASRSASSAATYSLLRHSPRASCELKSQYGHLRTHQGRCT